MPGPRSGPAQPCKKNIFCHWVRITIIIRPKLFFFVWETTNNARRAEGTPGSETFHFKCCCDHLLFHLLASQCFAVSRRKFTCEHYIPIGSVLLFHSLSFLVHISPDSIRHFRFLLIYLLIFFYHLPCLKPSVPTQPTTPQSFHLSEAGSLAGWGNRNSTPVSCREWERLHSKG